MRTHPHDDPAATCSPAQSLANDCRPDRPTAWRTFSKESSSGDALLRLATLLGVNPASPISSSRALREFAERLIVTDNYAGRQKRRAKRFHVLIEALTAPLD